MAYTPEGFKPAPTHEVVATIGDHQATTGSFVPLQKFKDSEAAPALNFTNVPGDSGHVVAMIDLDAPMAEQDRSYSPLLHWLTPVAPGVKKLSLGDSTTSAVAKYFGPQPPSGSGPHRYVILVLASPNGEAKLPEAFDKNYDDIMNRAKFDLEGLINAGGFKPVAATWFTTKPSE